jgi:predicted ATPase/DNA-binding winged helix-turn-helix (wHTH) protein
VAWGKLVYIAGRKPVLGLSMDLQFAGYELKLRERQLIGPGGSVDLSSRSFDILVALLARPNKVVGKSELFDAAWPGVVVEENTLQVHVSSLRKILGPGYIATVHGRGYKYVGPTPQSVVAGAAASDAMPMEKGNVPNYRPECVAREDELAKLAGLLGRHKITSIVGPGGVGKTTLAVEIAARQQEFFSGGVWIVDLAPVSDPVHVASAIGQTLGMLTRKSMAIENELAEYLRSEELLLVLDNCEHVLGGAGHVLKVILARAPRVKVLATSQIPLGLPDEQVFKLGTFKLPEKDQNWQDSQSGRFFRHCYESQGETISGAEWDTVSRLCRNLDGMALALKMAAARAATLGIAAVEQQIKSELSGLFASWPTDLPRHKSLMAAMTWSHSLLKEPERKVFRGLSVFSGSFSLEAALAVAGAGEAESLSELVRKSLVVRDGNGTAHYRLLETSRHFARDQLVTHKEVDEARRWHASYFTSLFRNSLDEWERLTDRQWLDVYGHETDNLRSALEWLREQTLWREYADLCAASYRLWLETGLYREGMSHCERALQALGNFPDRDLDARLRLGFAELCRTDTLDQQAITLLEPALHYYRETRDAWKLAQALALATLILLTKLRREPAHAAATELEALVLDMAASKVKARALVVIGTNHWERGDRLLGLAKCEAGLAMHRATGNTRSGLRSGLFVAEALHQGGDNAQAILVGTEMLRELRAAGYKMELGYQLSNLAAYHLADNAADQAREMLLEAVEYIARDNTNWHWGALQNAAGIEAIAGDVRRAARLMGFLDLHFGRLPDPRQPTEEMQRRRIMERLKAELPAHELAGLLKEGQALSSFEADYLANFPGPEPDRAAS